MTVNSFTLEINGTPVGKGRPRFTSRGVAFTPRPTRVAENDIRLAWRAALSPRLPDDAPIAMYVWLFHERPKSHLKADGSLSALGRRTPFAIRKPDVDNSAKLVCDALNGLAYRDDAQITDLFVCRRWSDVAQTIVVVASRAALISDVAVAA